MLELYKSQLVFMRGINTGIYINLNSVISLDSANLTLFFCDFDLYHMGKISTK